VPAPGRKKLDTRRVECFFVGYEKTSKSFRFFNPKARTILVSRDAVFKEGGSLCVFSEE
jgi:hypothetical protein